MPDVSVELVVNTIEGIYPTLTLRVFFHSFWIFKWEYGKFLTRNAVFVFICLIDFFFVLSQL
jgi:hypothetical protein